MTTKRNKRQDREKTIMIIQQPNSQKSEDGKNWLGHKNTSKAASLDELLLNGTTMPEMQKVRGAIHEHIWHLENEHGLKINNVGEMYKIDRVDLGIFDEKKN